MPSVQMTNATKAQLIAITNAVFAVLIAFNVGLTQTQMSTITALVDGVLIVLVGVTYKSSPARKGDFKSGLQKRRVDKHGDFEDRLAALEKKLQVPDNLPADPSHAKHH